MWLIAPWRHHSYKETCKSTSSKEKQRPAQVRAVCKYHRYHHYRHHYFYPHRNYSRTPLAQTPLARTPMEICLILERGERGGGEAKESKIRKFQLTEFELADNKWMKKMGSSPRDYQHYYYYHFNNYFWLNILWCPLFLSVFICWKAMRMI